ncbi:MAG: glycosyltransferase family 39 protein [Gemmatimonadales bacterium]|nr:glycosyltransferase family 39 protein [Gemmatimonadales bacterium]
MRWALAAVVLLAFALRLLWLQDQSLSMDELAELTIAHSPMTDILWAQDGFPPLYHSILHAWLAIFPGDQSARWLSALFGTAAVGAVWGLARAVADERTALWAAFLVAVSPFQAWHAQEARAYILYYLIAACALWSFFTALKTDSPAAWAAYVAICWAGFLTHYYFALLVLSNLAILLVEGGGRLRRRAVIAHAGLALLSVPVAWLLHGDLSAEEAATFATTFHPAAIGYALFSFVSGYALGPSPRELHGLAAGRAVLAVLPWLLPIGISAGILLYHGLRVLGARLWGSRLLLAGVGPVVLCAALAGVSSITFQVRHVLWASILLMVVLGAGCTEWRSRKPVQLALLTLLLLFGVSRYHRHDLPRYQNEDLRGLASYLRTADPSTPVYVLSGYMAQPVRYYLGDGWSVFPVPDAGPDANALRTALNYLDSSTTPSAGFWFVYTRGFHGDPWGRLIDTLPRLRDLQRRKEFAGITLFAGGGGPAPVR